MKNQFENLFLLVLFPLLFLFSQSVLIAEDSDTLWTKNFMGSGYVSNALFSPDDKSIYVSTTEKFYELETETGKVIREIPEIRGMARYLNKKQFFISYDLKKYTYPEMQFVKNYDYIKNLASLKDYDFNFDASIVGYVNSAPYPETGGYILHIFDASADTLIYKLSSKENYKYFEFSPDGANYATISVDLGEISNPDDDITYLRIWDFKTNEQMHITEVIGYGNIKYSPDGQYLAYYNSTHIFLFNTQTWQLLDTFNFDPPYDISSFTFSNDSKYLYLAGDYRSINVFEIEGNKLIKTIGPKWLSEVLTLSHNNIYISGLNRYYFMMCKNTMTDIEKNNNEENLLISPNPVKDFIDISCFEIPVKNISIFDITGNLVFTKSNLISSEANLKLDLSFLQSGTYIINVKTSDNEYSAKFIKE